MPLNLNDQINENMNALKQKLGNMFSVVKNKINPESHNLFSNLPPGQSPQSQELLGKLRTIPEAIGGLAQGAFTGLAKGAGKVAGQLVPPVGDLRGRVEQGVEAGAGAILDPGGAYQQFAETGALGETLKKSALPVGFAIGALTPSPFDDLLAAKRSKGLTTKFIQYAEEKLAKNPNYAFNKQEILDFARRPELKKGEAEGLTKLLQGETRTKLPAQEFIDSIRGDLLELKPVKVKEPLGNGLSSEYEKELFKSGKLGRNYEEVVFESPITTNGSSHFPNSKNYFAHARGDEVVESGKKIWREQEIQSDIAQREGVERLTKQAKTDLLSSLETRMDDLRANFPNIKKSEIMEYIENCL